MGEFFTFLIAFFHKCVNTLRDTSVRLKAQYPNMFLGLCGLCMFILPTTIGILVVNYLNSIGLTITRFGFDASFVWTFLRRVMFSDACGWMLFASKATGVFLILSAIFRSVLQKRPKHGYLPLTNPRQSSPKKTPQTIPPELD